MASVFCGIEFVQFLMSLAFWIRWRRWGCIGIGKQAFAIQLDFCSYSMLADSKLASGWSMRSQNDMIVFAMQSFNDAVYGDCYDWNCYILLSGENFNVYRSAYHGSIHERCTCQGLSHLLYFSYWTTLSDVALSSARFLSNNKMSCSLLYIEGPNCQHSFIFRKPTMYFETDSCYILFLPHMPDSSYDFEEGDPGVRSLNSDCKQNNLFFWLSKCCYLFV